MLRPPGMDPHRKGSIPRTTPTGYKKLINWAYPKLNPPPAKYDELSLPSKICLNPMVTDGFNFLFGAQYQRGDSNKYSAAHVFNIPSKDEPATYLFHSNYTDHYIDVMGRMNTEGALAGRAVIQPMSLKKWPYVSRIANGILEFGVEGQAGEQAYVQASVGYGGSDFSCVLKHTFPMGISQFDYLQTLSRHLFAGFQATFRESQYIGTAFAAQYNSGQSSTTFVLNPLHMSVECFHYRSVLSVPIELNIGTDFTIQPSQSTQSIQSTWGIGYTLGRGERSNVRGRIESTGKVSCSMDELVSFLKLSISGELDHAEKKYKFGVGVEIV